MSQQRPAPNPIVTALLWGAVFFLGYQLFFANRGTSSDTRTPEEVFEKMLAASKDFNDKDVDLEFGNYDQKLKKQKEEGKITQAVYDEKHFVASFVKSYTRYANGVKNDNSAKIQVAYNDLNGLHSKYGKTELWQRQLDVTPLEGKLDSKTLSGEQLYALVVADLSTHNKSAKVVGYIPGYQMMDWLVNLTGASPNFSYWFAALLLAFLVRLAVFPLAQKQYMWGRRMSQLSPYIKEIQEKFKDKKTGKITDQQAMTAETMELYKRYGFNPFAGCWPMFIQLPLFLIIYQCMLLYRFEFTKGYFLWIQPDAGSFLGLSLAPNLGEKDYLLIVVYGISMVVTTLMTPVSDPANIRQQRLMGIGIALVFSIMMFFYPLPSAFIAYWIFTNILATAQSLYVYRMPIEPLKQVQSVAGGAIPTTGRDMNGKTDVDPGFFGKTGKNRSKKKKK